MTLAEFAKICSAPLCAKSGFNDKILCRRFNPEKHTELGKREVVAVWAEIVATKSIAFTNSAQPVLMVYVDGKPEYDAFFSALRSGSEPPKEDEG